MKWPKSNFEYVKLIAPDEPEAREKYIEENPEIVKSREVLIASLEHPPELFTEKQNDSTSNGTEDEIK